MANKESSSPPVDRNAVFKRAPDPWKEVVRLEYGGDGSFASAIEQAVRGASAPECLELEKRLIRVLGAKECTLAAKDFVCRMLALAGSEAFVASVAPFLRDLQTASLARLALEPIPGAAVDAALQAALSEAKGTMLLGLIGTLGMRREPGAVPVLEKLKNSSADADVQQAAQRAITFIGRQS